MTTATIEKRKYTPPEVARMYGVSVETIHAHIRAGRMRAINMARPGRNQRPRYKIDVRDLEDFDRARAVSLPPSKPPRRKRREKSDHDFY